MAYKRISAMDVYQLLSRWHAGYNISQISQGLGVDRKTVRQYVTLAQQVGLDRNKPLPDKAALLQRLDALIPGRRQACPARSVFLAHEDEIIHLLTDSQNPLKPKTVYEILCERYGMTASYTSFKRFIREHAAAWGLTEKRATTCRFETEPGEEIQIDYGKMGRLYDPATRRNRDVYAFVAMLSFSRFKFVDFVYKQEQRSFVGSHLRLFDAIGGTPQRLVIDNLKAGVLKPDLYLPRFNRTYQEMAEHYSCFIDPARSRHPQDKGKVERAMPGVRELFRKLKALYPDLDIARANREAKIWCRDTNGMKIHGTTGLKPYEVFQNIEQARLKPLPSHPFETPIWKSAVVHVDQFIQFDKHFYALPDVTFVGKTVWVRATEKLVHIYDNHTLIRMFVRGQQRRQYRPGDFPDNFRIMLESRDVQTLIDRASAVGPAFKKLIVQVLSPHAKLNYRRALALLRLREKYPAQQLNQAAEYAASHNIHTPQHFKALIEKLNKAHDEKTIPISEQTQLFLRDPDYFIH